MRVVEAMGGTLLTRPGAQMDARDKRRLNDIIVAVLFGGLGLVAVVSSVLDPGTFRPVDAVGPNGFPIAIGSVIILCAAVVVGRQLIAWRKGEDEDEAAVFGAVADEPHAPASAWRALAVMTCVVVYLLLWEPLGFILASILFVLAGLRVMNVTSWKLLAATSLGYAAGAFVTFGLLLDVSFPLGPLNALFVELGLVEAVR